MPLYGGVAYGERYGGSSPRIESILGALNEARGTAYDVSPDSNVWVENLALARAIADVFDTSEVLSYQADPRRMTVLLPRWEAICGLRPLPWATLKSRREAVGERLARLGDAVTSMRLEEKLRALLGPVDFELVHSDASGPHLSSWADDWYVQPRSLSSTRLRMTGVPFEAHEFQLYITKGGQAGNAEFTWSTDGGRTLQGPVVSRPVASATVLPRTGLSLWFEGAYEVGDVYFAEPSPTGQTSTLARLTVACRRPGWMPHGDYAARAGAVKLFLDDVLPAWCDFNVALDEPRGPGFYLDEPSNLDNQRLRS